MEDLSEVFKSELYTFQPALFSSKWCMRKGKKSALAHALWSSDMALDLDFVSSLAQYVLNGGGLVHHIQWTKGSIWDAIRSCMCTMSRTIMEKLSWCLMVTPVHQNTKDYTHQERTRGRIGAVVYFTRDIKLQTKKEEFQSNPGNKQRFSDVLSKQLQDAGCVTHHAEDDTDVLIAQTAIASADENNTVVIADDTDLLVLYVITANTQNLKLSLSLSPTIFLPMTYVVGI